MLEWSKPTAAGTPTFAYLNGVILACVNSTAFKEPEKRWLVEIYNNGPKNPGLYGYAGSEAQAKRHAERWLIRRLKAGWRPK